MGHCRKPTFSSVLGLGFPVPVSHIAARLIDIYLCWQPTEKFSECVCVCECVHFPRDCQSYCSDVY